MAITGANVHLDSAKARFWEAATSQVRTAESDYNRRIYLSTDYDRYRAGDTVQLSFSSVSDFGFGIKRSALLVEESQGGTKVVTAELEPQDDPDCVMMRDRERSRFLRVALPKDLREGRYRIQIDFCKRPFEEMPLKTSSNAIEIHSPGP